MRYIVVVDWMISELHLSGDMLLAYAWIFDSFKLNQNSYYDFNETLSYMSYWFDSDMAKANKLIEDLEEKGLLTIDRYLDKQTGKTMAKIIIHEPKK